MKSEFERTLIESGNLMRKRSGFLLENFGLAVALICALVAGVVVFADVSFDGVGTKDLTSMLLVMLMASFAIFFSLEDSGERAAKTTAEYRDTFSRYKKMRDCVSGDMVTSLREFCQAYTAEEVEYRRRSLLLSYGLSYESYLEFLEGRQFSKGEMRIFRRVRRLRTVNLTPKLLLSNTKDEVGELENPERKKFFHLFLKMLPTAICMVFTVSVALNLKDGLSAEAVLEGILKLSTLPVAAFRGYMSGYSYVAGPLQAWQKTKTDMLEAFLRKSEKTQECIPEYAS